MHFIYFIFYFIAAERNLADNGLEWQTDQGENHWEGQLVDGARHGKWLNFNASGQIIEEQNWRNGSLEGASIHYNCLGKPRSEIYYTNGKANGESISWYEDGSVFSKTMYIDGKKCGVEIFYYSDGRPFVEREWEIGHLCSEKQWNPDGLLLNEILIHNDILDCITNPNCPTPILVESAPFVFEYICTNEPPAEVVAILFLNETGEVGGHTILKGQKPVLGFNEAIYTHLTSRRYLPMVINGKAVPVKIAIRIFQHSL